jgi:4a-hydroxytetrahydrobiopterin dehydratase
MGADYMPIQPLNDSELTQSLQELEGWSIKEGKLHVELKFDDFVQTFGFMTQVAILVAKMDHHPEWCNVYNQLTIDLVTHDAGNAISGRDIKLAKAINQLLK